MNKIKKLIMVFAVLFCMQTAINASNVKEEWSKQYGTSSTDMLDSVISTDDGGFIAVGNTIGTVTNGTALGKHDGWIIKINPDGDEIFSKQYGSTKNDFLFDLIATNDGEYVATGHTNEGALTNSTPLGGFDGWIIKFDSNGNEIFSKQYGTDGSDSLYGVFSTNKGNFVATGNTNGNLTTGSALGGTDG